MSRKGGKKTGELLVRLIDLGARELVEQLTLPEPQARELMREIAHNLARHYGGQFMYCPLDLEYALTKRDMAIFEAFNGSNAHELGEQHKVTVRQIYSIIKHVRDQLVRKRQNLLPGFEEA